MSTLTAIGRLVVSSRVSVWRAVVWMQTGIVLLALGLPLTASQHLDRPLPTPGGISVYVSDVVVALAVVSWLAARLLIPASERGTWLRTPVLTWPLLVFAAFLVPGIVRGHERYGASYLGQPVRLVLYAGIAFAMTELRPREVYRAIVAVFYAGTVWQAASAVYYLVTGTSQTTVNELSTGGVRALSLTSGMYVAAALVLALLNVELASRTRWRLFHLGFAALAAFGVVASFSRTTFLAVVLLTPFLVWQLREMRGGVLRRWRWWLPAGAAAIVAGLVLIPGLSSTFVDRVSANPLTDRSVEWRVRGIHAALTGMKSGRWQPNDRATVLNPNVNHLSNGDFETGTKPWLVQGGQLSTIDSNNPFFGQRSLQLVTHGRAVDEGFYSEPVVAVRGQTWTFSIWLKGTRGGERVNLGIWQYASDESGTGQANFPVTLSLTPTQYFITSTITGAETTHIRALVRTEGSPQAITIYGDTAKLRGKLLAETGPNRGVYPYSFVGGGVVPPRISKSGVWEPVDGAAFGVPGPNRIVNGGFEQGTVAWAVQGGEISTIPSNNPSFGARSLDLKTDGKSDEDGLVSDAVPAQSGETWTFSVWLKGTLGGERAILSVWEYGADGSGTGQANYPVTLTITPTQYSATTRVVNPNTTEIRALVRTQESTRPVELYADAATLRLRDGGSSQSSAGANASREPPKSSFHVAEPLLGLGFGRTVSYVWNGRFYRVDGDPDNSYVFILAGGGALALAAFLFIFAAYVRDGWRRLRASVGIEHALVAWALATWFIIAVNIAMAPFLPRPKIVLTLWAVLVLPALVRRARGRSAETRD
jgi:Carbohydrate binding domain